ncbi:unnamed protein product [Rhizoctonia solani]|uniref:Uncharacterized protein n=1 Tax=Rhizoctonia solani TaxID=456999 RepID=A0A8H3C283_9AGAM|nr:unnamed protein product [Rhizoctonia solani]
MPKNNAVCRSEPASNGQFQPAAPRQTQAHASPLLRALSSQLPANQQGAPNAGLNQAGNGANAVDQPPHNVANGAAPEGT